MLRLNLKFKLIGLIAGLIVIILAGAGILIIRQVEKAMDHENHKRGLAVANDLARFSSSALISRDLSSLRYYVKYTMQQDYIQHAVILDTHGKVIMHNKLSEVGKIYADKLSRAAIRAKKPIQGEHYSTKEGEILNDIIVPVEVAGTRLGTVIIGCSHTGIEKEIAILKRKIGVMVLMAILVGMVFAIILAIYISGPLKKLRAAAVEIGKGKRDITLKVKSKDEIGDLVNSFNKMAIDLRNTTVSRDLLMKEVTDRKRAEGAMRDSEVKLAGVVESVTDAIIMVDKQFNILWTNDIAKGLFGPEFMDKKCYAAFHGRNRICEPCIVNQCFEDGRVHEFETEIVGANGKNQRTFWCTASVAAWQRHQVGRPKMVVEFLRDITDRKRAQETLRESEQRFRDLVENSLTGIFIIQDDQIVYKNPEQERLFGPLHEPFKFTDFENIHPDDVEKFKRFFQRVLSGDARTLDSEMRFYPVSKMDSGVDMRWVHCRASLIEHQGKDAILVNMMDITRAKELEHLVLMRQKMVSLGHVAAGIAHEIRNPLSGINVYLTTLKKIYNGSDSFEPESMGKVKKILGQVQSASGKIESVIKRVMDFSKPSIPKLALTDINESIEEAINLSSVTLRKSGITIAKSLAPDLPPCYADPQLIEQVILNLITNAAEAMKKMDGPKRTEITSTEENTRIIITVSDSGPGVPSNIRDKIFDPFFTTKSNSSGIGLSLSHRIITDHGGSLKISASRWGGAEFTIEIPMGKRMYPI